MDQNQPLLRWIIWLSFIFSLAPNTGRAQRPNTNIYLFDLTLETPERVLRSPKMVTAHHPGGYNNQPVFFSANEIWFTSDYQDTSQTDIWMVDLNESTLRRITRTTRSEYSPTSMNDNLHYSTVVVESDAGDNQRLWQYPRQSGEPPRPLFPDISGVGYHCWLNADTAVLFLVGDPHSLHLASRIDEQDRYLTSRVGRSLHVDGQGRLLFVQKVTDEDWYVKRYDPQYDRTELLVKTKPGAEDFAILPDQSLIMAMDNVIYRYDPKTDITWRPLADLSEWNLNNIKRLSLWKDKKLLVVNQSDAP